MTFMLYLILKKDSNDSSELQLMRVIEHNSAASNRLASGSSLSLSSASSTSLNSSMQFNFPHFKTYNHSKASLFYKSSLDMAAERADELDAKDKKRVKNASSSIDFVYTNHLHYTTVKSGKIAQGLCRFSLTTPGLVT